MSFSQKVLEIIKDIPKGKVITYKMIADKLKTSPRAVGQALKKNKNLIIVPCHRVIMSNGKLGGYVKGTKKKKELLIKEGVDVNNLLKYLVEDWK